MIEALVLSAASVAFTAPETRCRTLANEAAMFSCLTDEFGRAEEELGEKWRAALHRARQADADAHRPSLSQVDALRDSERAWIRFRDTECGWRALLYWGGSIVPTIRLLCMIELSQTRARQLEDR
jgi:uncharacterized protein YecT (DUF1311 family)